MRVLWLADVARAAGLNVVEADGWKTRGRSSMNPRGVVAHHTATPSSWSRSQLTSLLVRGHSTVPGPLCHYQLERDGTVVVIAAGRANHAGSGSWRGLSGNSSVIGIEAANTGGGERWPTAQLDAYDRLAAAVLAKLGRDEQWLCAHREWTPRKIDPRGIDMDAMRSRVRALLSGVSAMSEEDDMTPDQAKMLQEVHAALEPKAGKVRHQVWGHPMGRTDITHSQTLQGVRNAVQTLLGRPVASVEVDADEVAAAVLEAYGSEVAGSIADELARRLGDR